MSPRAFALAAFLARAAHAQPAPTDTVTLVAAGDIVVHRRVAAAATAHLADGGYAWVLGPLRAELPPESIAIANLETPLSERYRRPGNTTPPVLGADPSLAAALAATGFDVVSLANNHAYDQTARGLTETLAALRDAGVASAGAGASNTDADRPVVLRRGAVRVALLAFTDRVNSGPGAGASAVALGFSPDGRRTRAALRAARASADVVVLSIHWSRDFVYAPTPAQRAQARAWIDAGADVILGTGPHVLQRVERLASPRGEAVVAWSLGNLLSNQGWRHRPGLAAPSRTSPEDCPYARDGALLRVTFVRDGARLRVGTLTAVPLWTENDGATTLRAAPLRTADVTVRTERRAAIATALGAAVTLLE